MKSTKQNFEMKKNFEFYCGDLINSNVVKPCTKLWLERVLGSSKTKECVEKYRATGDDAFKKQLPFFCPQAAFPRGERKEAQAVSSGLFAIDIDDHDGHLGFDPQHTWETHIKPYLKENLGDVLMVYRTAGGRGMRVVAVRPVGMSIQSCQEKLFQRISQGQLPEELLDTKCHDMARAFFLSSDEDVFYLDYDRLFLEDAQMNPEGPEVTVEPAMTTEIAVATPAPEDETEEEKNPFISDDGSSYKDIPYGEIIQEICAYVLNIRGMIPEKGSRNNKLFQLCIMLSHITRDVNHMISQLPNWGLPQKEVEQTANSAWKRHLSEKFPVQLLQILDKLSGHANTITPPTLPRVLPKAIKVLLKCYPKYMHETLAVTMLGQLATLASGVRFYLNGKEEHALTFQTLLVAPQASGKSKMSHLYNRIMAPINKQDEVNRELMRKWKEENEATSQNKDKKVSPHLPYRNISPKCSYAQFLTLMIDAKGKSLSMDVPELDSMGGTTWTLSSETYRLAFDREKGGQETKSANSTSALVPIFLNLCMSGTPVCVFKKHFSNVENGTVSRILFTTLPDRYAMPNEPLKERTPEEEAYLDNVFEGLMHLGDNLPKEELWIDSSGIQTEINKWLKEVLDRQLRTGDQAIETFKKRDAIMGARAMALAMMLEGGKLTKAAVSYGLFIANTALYYHLRFYGDKQRQAEQEGQELMHGGVVSSRLRENPVFDSLPEVFSSKQYMEALQERGLKGTGYRVDLNGLKQKGWIVQTERSMFRKVHLG